MAQSNWYLRHEDQVFGPFPPLQIEEAMNAGEVTSEWEVSLNGQDWLSIADSGQFKMDQAVWSSGDTQESLSWHDQRQQARKRWLQDGASVTDMARDPSQDAALRSSVARDHIRTQALLQEEKSKHSSPWIALLGLALLAGVGIAVWLGQGDKPIQAGIGQTVNCSAALSDGVNWGGCGKHGFTQPGVKARNARMDKVQLEDAHLHGADLAYASLKSANLRNAELVRVNLTGADLSAADLSGADLTGADLRYAVLSKANLTGVRFSSTQLDKATWIDGRVCATGSMDVCR
jgi:uncharacterized protein YjbI with pentapeptide repeats